MDDLNPADSSPPSRRQRLLVYAVALAVAAGGFFLLSSAFKSGNGAGSSSSSGPSLVRVSCIGDATKVSTSEVMVQADGLHVDMEANFDQPVLMFFFAGGQVTVGLGPDFEGRSDKFVIPVPPGDLTLECGRSEQEEPSHNAVGLQLSDPKGLWHDTQLVCGGDIIEWNPSEPTFYYTHGNPFPDAVYHTLPGLHPDDQVVYAGYPEDQSGDQPLVMRDGEAIGIFDLSTYDKRTFVHHGIFCASSGIGQPEATTMGITSTPYQLPSLSACDPYHDECASVFMTAARYVELGGDSPDLLPLWPMAVCDKDTSAGCIPEPKDMVVRVVTAPDVAASFVDKNQCGSNEDTVCS